MAEVYPDYLSPEFVAMAHRGGSFMTANLGIENTTRAFANAVELGFRYLETDVHTTRDGHLVAFHDDTLDRLTDVEGSLRDLTLEEIGECLVGDREAIPTMDELFETFPDVNFNIDIKSATAVQGLVDCIKRHGAERRVCVASFARTRIRRFRSLLPRVPTAISPTGVAALTMGGISPGGQVYQVPLQHPVGPVTVDIVTPKNIERIHQAGKKIHVWTVDEPTTMHRLIDWGVDGIVTDRPDSLKQVLSARGMWSTQ